MEFGLLWHDGDASRRLEEKIGRAARRYLAYYNAQCHPFRWGHKRKHRVFLVGPLRRTVLWGRACGASLPDRYARLLAKTIIT